MGLLSKIFGKRKLENTTKEDCYTIDNVASLNNRGIELEKNGQIDEAIAIYESNLEYPATHSFERLMVLYHKKGDFDNEIRVIKKAIDIFSYENNRRANKCIESHPTLKDNILCGLSENKPIYDEQGLILFNPYDVHKYQKRLDKIQDHKENVVKIFPQKSIIHVPENTPLGLQFEQTIKMLPEFNFYYDIKDGQNTNEYLLLNKSKLDDKNNKELIWKIQNIFKSLLLEAKRQEEKYNYEEASEIYERIIGEHYYLPTPYDRLIKIYSNAKLKSEEKRVLLLSIEHFTSLKQRQTQYVLQLGEKYGKLDWVKKCLESEQKIMYYGGAFELYNPFPIIDTWKKRLEKL